MIPGGDETAVEPVATEPVATDPAAPGTPAGPDWTARDLEQITEIKTTLDGHVKRFVCQVGERSAGHVVVLYRMPAARRVHRVWLPAGTITVGYFWTDRPFNLYHWVTPQAAPLAHYFNIGDVVRLEHSILEWHDLAVDILATPDGRVEVLDEDELPTDLDPALRRHVTAARDQVLRELPRLVHESNEQSAQVISRLQAG